MPDDIDYVVCSHLHLDHGGNVGKFPNSTIVVQKTEVQNAIWPEPGTGGPYVLGDVSAAAQAVRQPAPTPRR